MMLPPIMAIDMFYNNLLLPFYFHWKWWFLYQSLYVVPDLQFPMNQLLTNCSMEIKRLSSANPNNFFPFHTDARRNITNICALPLLLFFGWIPCTGWLDGFLAQLSDRIHHFTVYKLIPLAFLTKLSKMHYV